MGILAVCIADNTITSAVFRDQRCQLVPFPEMFDHPATALDMERQLPSILAKAADFLGEEIDALAVIMPVRISYAESLPLIHKIRDLKIPWFRLFQLTDALTLYAVMESEYRDDARSWQRNILSCYAESHQLSTSLYRWSCHGESGSALDGLGHQALDTSYGDLLSAEIFFQIRWAIGRTLSSSERKALDASVKAMASNISPRVSCQFDKSIPLKNPPEGFPREVALPARDAERVYHKTMLPDRIPEKLSTAIGCHLQPGQTLRHILVAGDLFQRPEIMQQLQKQFGPNVEIHCFVPYAPLFGAIAYVRQLLEDTPKQVLLQEVLAWPITMEGHISDITLLPAGASFPTKARVSIGLVAERKVALKVQQHNQTIMSCYYTAPETGEYILETELKDDYTLSCCLQDTDGNTLLTIDPRFRRCDSIEFAFPISYLLAEDLTLEDLMDILHDDDDDGPTPIPEWT